MPRPILQSENGPAMDAAAITPHDTNELAAGPCRAIYVGVAGNITLVTPNGSEVLFSNVPVGIFPVGAKIVKSTGTAATGLVALY
jgi:hypothetical protein